MAVHYSNTIAFINKALLIKSQSAKLQSILEQKEKELAKITRYKQANAIKLSDGENYSNDLRRASGPPLMLSMQ
ncbi:hypothetical protein LBYZC6_51760 [Lacrimispora brassicae]